MALSAGIEKTQQFIIKQWQNFLLRIDKELEQGEYSYCLPCENNALDPSAAS
jgi:hypothetical protein